MTKQLFKDAQSIIKGYHLNAKRGERKVTLVGRALKSGNVALVRYSCDDYSVKRVSTGVVLKPENSQEIQDNNKELLRLQNVECDTINADLQRNEANFAPTLKGKVRLVDYIDKLGKDALSDSGNEHSVYATYQSMAKHIYIYGGDVKIGKVNEDWCKNFIEYLQKDALNLNYQRSVDLKERKAVKLSPNTQNKFVRNLNSVLNQAVRDKLIAANPLRELAKAYKIKTEGRTRVYLTKEEVQTLINTPFVGKNKDIKCAFLFSVLTGLRFSDLTKITPRDFKQDNVGTYLDIVMTKTQEPLKIYIPNNAMNLIQDRMNKQAETIFTLPKNCHANVSLKAWIKEAGISKVITFHCARHTAATLLLSSGLPIAIVSKQLGHLKIGTTEIYAKIVDAAQKEAANAMDGMFSI